MAADTDLRAPLASPRLAILADRGVLAITGEDRVGFLQGLVSNDVTAVGPERAIHAALLTPQGKYLHDFFIAELDQGPEIGGALLLEVESARRDDLLRRLKLYKLRAKVVLSDVSDRFSVVVGFGSGAASAFGLPGTAGRALGVAGGVAMIDPRLAALGVRAILPRPADQAMAATGLASGSTDEYQRHRLGLGVPDGTRDLIIDKSILLESNFDLLNGVAWEKGCYIGQELTARTKYRGLIKKRLLPVVVEGPLPAPGTVILAGEREAGEMRSGCGDRGLALLRLDEAASALAGTATLSAGAAVLRPFRPDWASF